MGKPQSVSEYLSALPEAQDKALRSLRDTIRAAAPNAQETISSGRASFQVQRQVSGQFRCGEGPCLLVCHAWRRLEMLEKSCRV